MYKYRDDIKKLNKDIEDLKEDILADIKFSSQMINFIRYSFKDITLKIVDDGDTYEFWNTDESLFKMSKKEYVIFEKQLKESGHIIKFYEIEEDSWFYELKSLFFDKKTFKNNIFTFRIENIT